jgi:histidinol-phosphate/aromatic aminotransferase/cobyric acid decarboxylase-like protein
MGMGEIISDSWAQTAQPRPPRFVVCVATHADREEIYQIRHEVYARELAQHATNASERLTDALDSANVYIVAKHNARVAGFISLTPPAVAVGYSVDKYFSRGELPIRFDEKLFEIRLLTVRKGYRGTQLALLLMYAAFRWVEAHAGTDVIAIGRREVVDLYERAGLKRLGFHTRSGAVTYDLMQASVGGIRERLAKFSGMVKRLEESTDWRLSLPFQRPAPCFHGGAFFQAIGEKFERLERSREVINADVLDAWFPPSPKVTAALQKYLPWLLRTSPPTNCDGLIETVAEIRGVRPENVLPGAGSSDLIFRALSYWLSPNSRVLLLDPTYGEYAHVLTRVVGCSIDRFELRREDGYQVSLGALEAALTRGYDLAVLVNPNSPTGRHVPHAQLATMLAGAPSQVRVWVDETYVEYAATGESLETFAAQSENVIVCKSMSKVYALSGARVAYLCAGAHQLEALRAVTPPWVVSLPAQVAAVNALQDPGYYCDRYAETAALRGELSRGLRALGWDMLPGIANFVLCHLPPSGPTAQEVASRCRKRDLFIRDAGAMGSRLGTHTLRIAVKDRETNERMLVILRQVQRQITSRVHRRTAGYDARQSSTFS